MLNIDYINYSSKEDFILAYSKDKDINCSLAVEEFDNAVLLPNNSMNGGVYVDNEFVYNTSLHRNWIKKFPNTVSSENYIDEEVVYVGMMAPIWGHCITDNLKHLWFLFDKQYSSLKDKKFVYMNVFPNQSVPKNFINMLLNLGIQQEQLVCIEVPTKFRKVYVPDECWFVEENLGYCYTEQYKKVLNRSFNQITPNTKYEKVYFSRTKLKNYKDINEKSVEMYFEKHGYVIIHPQEISFEEQVSILKGCRYFATTEGSISHNVIFCNKDSNVIILRKDDKSINGYQTTLNKMVGCNVTFIDANHSRLLDKKHPWNGSFFLCVTKYLASYFNDKRVITLSEILLYIFKYIPIQILKGIKRFIKK